MAGGGGGGRRHRLHVKATATKAQRGHRSLHTREVVGVIGAN